MSAAGVEARLSGLVRELLEAVDGIVPASARYDLERGRERLEHARLNLVVLGEFKRGKSSLVNALLGHEVLPTGVLPLTAAVVVIRHGEVARLVVEFEDGGRAEPPPHEIASYATEAGNPRNRRGVRLVTVELPAALLAAGLQLVDTPGIGSVFAHNTETALGFLAQVDAGLFTLAADQPLSEAEEQLIRKAAERLPRVFFALNKIDRLEEAERDEVTGFALERLREGVGGEPELYPVSARTGEGLEELRRRLAELAAAERQEVVGRSVRSLAERLAAEALQAVRFEAHAVALPAAELERRLEEFRARAAELERSREEAASLLREATRRLVRETVNEPLLGLARAEREALAGGLRAFAARQGPVAPRELAGRADGWVDRAIGERFERLRDEYEQRVAAELEGLHERYAERVEQIMAALDDAADEVFGERVGRLLPEVALRRASRFAFKLHDVEREPLDQLASAATASVPGGLGRRLVLRQAEERLALLLDRHAGRLRSDLAGRIEESVREYERELDFAVREAVAAVEAAVERRVAGLHAALAAAGDGRA